MLACNVKIKKNSLKAGLQRLHAVLEYTLPSKAGQVSVHRNRMFSVYVYVSKPPASEPRVLISAHDSRPSALGSRIKVHSTLEVSLRMVAVDGPPSRAFELSMIARPS